MNTVSAALMHSSRTIASRRAASKYCGNLPRSWLPSVSRNSLHRGLQVGVHSITVFKYITKLAQCWLPSTSLSPVDLGLQAHFHTCSITASTYIYCEGQWLDRDSGVLEVDRAMVYIRQSPEYIDIISSPSHFIIQ
jgi:hypothetical protein